MWLNRKAQERGFFTWDTVGGHHCTSGKQSHDSVESFPKSRVELEENNTQAGA